MEEISWDASKIDLNKLLAHARGDQQKMLRYLQQFQQLIPERLEQLNRFHQEGNRSKLRQCLHQMSPQLEFFGVPDVIEPIQLIGTEYIQLDVQTLDKMVENISLKLQSATLEINRVIDAYFHD